MGQISRFTLKHDQRGMSAIVVTMILTIVISIITLSFASVVRREQRQSLDNQLSTQAFYAAESGVNLAKSKIAGGFTGNKTSCDETTAPSPFVAGDYTISTTGDVKITCLMISNEVPSLEFQQVNSPRVTKIKDKNGVNLSQIDIAWEDSTSVTIGCNAANASNRNFPTGAPGTWGCGQPLLRIDLVPLCETAGCASQQSLQDNQFTSYLYPIAGTKPTVFNYASSSTTNLGSVQAVSCNTDKTVYSKLCVAQINLPSTSSVYAARISSSYGTANVTISARAGGSPSILVEGQALVDSTARAIDVIKRVQTRIGFSSEVWDAALTLTGLGICKQYFVTDSNVTIPSGYIGDSSNPCAIP